MREEMRGEASNRRAGMRLPFHVLASCLMLSAASDHSLIRNRRYLYCHLSSKKVIQVLTVRLHSVTLFLRIVWYSDHFDPLHLADPDNNCRNNLIIFQMFFCL